MSIPMQTNTSNSYYSENNSETTIVVSNVEEKYIPMIDLDNQAKPVDKNTKCCASVDTGKYLLTCEPQIKTLLDCIYRGYKISKEKDCLGLISPYLSTYEWFSYSQILFRMKTFGSGLVSIGCEPNNNTIIALFSRNNFKLMIAEYACYHFSMAVVPIYDTTESNTWKYIFQQIEPKCVITDSNERAKQLMASLRYRVESLVLTCDHIHPETQIYAEKKGTKVYAFKDIEKLGIVDLHTFKIPNPTDLAIISYTSGTTGNPKGALLTHGNLVAAVSGLLLHLDSHFSLRDETMISYLSSAQLRERILKACMFYSGGRIGIYSGDFKDLSRDLPVLQPTVMICVPRILNRLYNRVISKVRGNWVRARVLDIALKSKQPEIVKAVSQTASFWDKVVFKTVKKTLGGKLKLLISGSSQISSTVLNFMRSSFGCVVIEGYGCTECSSFVTLTHCGDQSTGHLGPPLACNIVKLVDVKELNIFTDRDAIGEICVKGTNVFSGFFKDSELSEQVFDEDGWFHTGDIGTWLKNGTLKVLDRREHIFQLSNSLTKEFIAPDKIENIYIQSIYVGQCYIDSDYFQSSLIGIIIPDVDGINMWCAENNMLLSAAEACRNVVMNKTNYPYDPYDPYLIKYKAFKKAVLNDILNIGKREGLQPYEQVTDIAMHSEPFTQESGFLTPTMKLKRHECRVHFTQLIEETSKGESKDVIQKII